MENKKSKKENYKKNGNIVGKELLRFNKIRIFMPRAPTFFLLRKVPWFCSVHNYFFIELNFNENRIHSTASIHM